MPFIEQLLCGVDINDNGQRLKVLARSPNVTQEVTAEVVRLCENWGTPPPLGLDHPALMSFRLSASLPSVPGRLFTVIRVSAGLEPLFHAVVFSESTYASFFRNPFAVARSVAFEDVWTPGLKLELREIVYCSSDPLVDPPAGAGDIGLVDEAVLKLIAEGKLMMPIEMPSPQSDRCLALIIACLPESERKNLRFASFAPSGTNSYTLAGLQSAGCSFAGWQRMLMTWLAGEHGEEVETYIRQVREYLQAGDLAGMARLSERNRIQSGSGSESPEKQRRETISAVMRGPASRPAPFVLSAAEPIRPMKKPHAAATRTPVPGRGPETPVRSQPPAPVRAKRKATGGARVAGPRPRPQGKFLRGALLVLVLALAGTAAVMWQEGRTLAESLEWANLQGLLGEKPRTERAATLLEVVDVGEVYRHELKLVAGSGRGLNPSLDKGRRKALDHLRDEAAAPLDQQVQLFAKLASDGIQQGSRPDRESQRMKALASQGLVLENELARLELAWYSLAMGVFWQDLPTLSDEAVSARRDSLARSEKGALEDARLDLGTSRDKVVLDQARGNVDGMASLLSLFEEKSWSPGWEKSLAKAAGQVSTTASRMTRAYANSAFALLRLKKAENAEAQTALPFRRDLKDQDWPSAEIRSLLINLRAQAVIFTDGQAPALLTGTLDLYTALKRPAYLASAVADAPEILDTLAANRAVRFHPAVYDDFLQRIRFEAALLRLEGDDDPNLIPAHLYGERDRDLVVGFRQCMAGQPRPAVWDSVASAAGQPFLARWAGHLASAARVDLDTARQACDAAWLECRQAAVRLQDEATAGGDWSAAWGKVARQCQAILTDYESVLARDGYSAAKLADVRNLLVTLMAPLPLGLEAATIRLDQDRMPEATAAVLEIRVVPDGETVRSKRFNIGPAAPEGMGWVGTVALDRTVEILPRQGMEIRIIVPDTQETLLLVSCPSLAEGTGPGGMVRPRSGGRGSVSLKLSPAYWKSLHLPDLGMIF